MNNDFKNWLSDCSTNQILIHKLEQNIIVNFEMFAQLSIDELVGLGFKTLQAKALLGAAKEKLKNKGTGVQKIHVGPRGPQGPQGITEKNDRPVRIVFEKITN